MPRPALPYLNSIKNGMKNKKQIWFSGILAGTLTLIDIFHKKYGGLLTGGRESLSHTWQEIAGMAPLFLATFIVSFLGAYLYFGYTRRK